MPGSAQASAQRDGAAGGCPGHLPALQPQQLAMPSTNKLKITLRKKKQQKNPTK